MTRVARIPLLLAAFSVLAGGCLDRDLAPLVPCTSCVDPACSL